MATTSATLGAPKSIDDLKRLLRDDFKVKVAVDGVLRGKFMSKDKFLGAVTSEGFGFCSVIFGWDMHDTVYPRELAISNRQNGYRDMVASIDLSTYRRIPWENNVPFFLVSFFDPTTSVPICADPRGVLRKVVDNVAADGMTCIAGVEFEYFNFKETPESAAQKQFTQLQPLTPGMHGYSLLRTQLNQEYFHALFDESLKFGIDIEGHHTETGPGVLETALAYTSAVRMADNAILYKFLAKSVGLKHGVLPSFMAKPWGNLPGCSGHIHVSLKDEEGRNVFSLSDVDRDRGRATAAFEDTRYLSQIGEYFLAGVLDGLPDGMIHLVPTINGYKRLVAGEAFWAPNAVTYGYDSRAASVRIISPPSVPPSATRLEVRVPGADMNPYFALSAIFQLGMRGIAKQLKLTIPPISTYQSDPARKKEVVMLPCSLEEATEAMMRPTSVAREVFGDDFVDHFGATRQHEVRLWNAAVTNWEVERYLELA
ncbi:glutamine synthetase guanido kinase [Suillus paluster]|uniref:glutamine synthetase guanido kinase n=1 Tax=Suillus paluster TaxID=48578 RepID=UPI001B866F39|nr:glutamine synthetase guanido kinase [Suillus paluster]KAG1739399.1 glutamine synthetase guanido kinase [Suillus paluster]